MQLEEAIKDFLSQSPYFKHLKHLADIPNVVEQLSKLSEQVYFNRMEDAAAEWIPQDVVLKKWGLSKRKMLQLRSQKKISYVKINKNLIFISKAELTRFMNDHAVKSTTRDSINN